MTKIFYGALRMQHSAESNDRMFANTPVREDLDKFLQETETWVNQNGMRIVSVTAVTGGLIKSAVNYEGTFVAYRGTSITCGLIIVAETK